MTVASRRSPIHVIDAAVSLLGDTLMWLAGAIGLLASMIPPLQEAFAVPMLVVAPVGIALCILRLRLRVKVTVGLMLFVGVLLCAVVGATWTEIASALISMCGLFAFVFITRLLELPFMRRHLDLVLASRLSRIRTGGSLVMPGAAFSFLLALPLSMGSVPVSFHAVRKMFASKGGPDDAAAGGLVSRSFLNANMISPMSPPVAISLAAAGLTWIHYLPVGVGLAILGLLLTYLGPRPAGRMAEQVLPERSGRLGEFALSLGAVVIVIVLLQWRAPSIGSIGAAVVAVLLIVPVWEWLTGGAPSLLLRLRELVVGDRGMWHDQFTLLAAGGFVAAAAIHWGATTSIFDHGVSPRVILLLLPLTLGLLGLAGLYPMTSLLFVCSVLPPLGDQTWALMVVGAAMIGSSIGFAVSPLSGLTLLVAAMSGTDSVQVAVRWNGLYALGLLVTGTAALAVVAPIVGIGT